MPKFRIKFPQVETELIDYVDLNDAANEIKESVSCLVLYENQEGRHEMLFSGFNENLLGSILVAMGTYPELYKFLLLAVKCHAEYKKEKPSSIKLIDDAVRWIEKNLNRDTENAIDNYNENINGKSTSMETALEKHKTYSTKYEKL